MAVSLDSDGWHTIAPSGDSLLIYVSNGEGNDTTGDGSIGAPYKTLSKAMGILNARPNGSPDHVLLKRGDTWTDEALGFVKNSGRSADEPIHFGAYGTGARPLIKVPRGTRGLYTAGGAGGQNGGNFVAVTHLEFYYHTNDPASPTFNSDFTVAPSATSLIHWSPGPTMVNIQWVLFEGLRLRFGQLSMEQDGSGFYHVRRNVITDNYSSTGRPQGIYGDFANFEIEENVLDHNGWHETYGYGAANGGQLAENHNVYLQSNPERIAIFRGNICARAAGNGLQQRLGGLTEDNLFLQNPVQCLTGGGTSAQVINNVCLESRDVTPTDGRGQGIEINPYAGGGAGLYRVVRNIVANSLSTSGNRFGILLRVHTRGVSVDENVVYNHGGGSQRLWDTGTGNALSNNQIDAVDHPDPTRSIAAYMTSLGLTASVDAFLAECRLQEKDNWRSEFTAAAVNDYIRAGFGVQKAGRSMRIHLSDSADAAAPVLSSPSASALTATTGTASVTTDTGEGVIRMAVTKSATPPTAAQIRAGKNDADALTRPYGVRRVTAPGTYTFSLSSDEKLTSLTTYYAYFMHEDEAGNQSAVVAAAPFTTP